MQKKELKENIIVSFKNEDIEHIKLILEHIDNEKIRFEKPLNLSCKKLLRSRMLLYPDLLQDLLEKKIINIIDKDIVLLVMKIVESDEDVKWYHIECLAQIFSIDNLFISLLTHEKCNITILSSVVRKLKSSHMYSKINKLLGMVDEISIRILKYIAYPPAYSVDWYPRPFNLYCSLPSTFAHSRLVKLHSIK